jgi:regulator of sigma E protease
MMISILANVFVFGMVIFFHEFGHFIWAKKVGIRVELFSFGFGPKLIGLKRGDTEYRLSAIPLGGYIKMAGEDLEEDYKGEPWEFNSKTPGQRARVVFAGPLGNFVLAFLLLSLIFMIGVPFYGAPFSLLIGSVQKDSPAWKAGLKSGDKILALNDEEINDVGKFIKVINETVNKEVKLRISRGEEEITKYIIPQFDPQLKKGRIGIGIGMIGEKEGVEKFGFFHSLGKGAQATWKFVMLIYFIFWQLLTLQLSPSQLGGPLGIAQMVGEVAKIGGLINLLYLLAFLSVNIGVVNLLPIPILDGGHLIFLGIEKIKGRPLGLKKREIIQHIGFAFLIFVFIFVTFNDLNRWVEQKKWSAEKKSEEKLNEQHKKAPH